MDIDKVILKPTTVIPDDIQDDDVNGFANVAKSVRREIYDLYRTFDSGRTRIVWQLTSRQMKTLIADAILQEGDDTYAFDLKELFNNPKECEWTAYLLPIIVED